MTRCLLCLVSSERQLIFSSQTLHFWNTTTSARLNSLTTNSQVTSIVWNPHAKEVLSSHGFPDNQLSVWSYPTLGKIADINQAHDTRVLFSALSPDGCTVATASSDENLKYVPSAYLAYELIIA